MNKLDTLRYNRYMERFSQACARVAELVDALALGASGLRP